MLCPCLQVRTCRLISPHSGRDCVKSLRSSDMGWYPQAVRFRAMREHLETFRARSDAVPLPSGHLEAVDISSETPNPKPQTPNPGPGLEAMMCLQVRCSGDTTPCKDTPVILHGSGDTIPCRMTGVTLHTGLNPQSFRAKGEHLQMS